MAFRLGYVERWHRGVISTVRCNTDLEFLRWCLILQGLSRALLELARSCAEFGLAEAQIRVQQVALQALFRHQNFVAN